MTTDLDFLIAQMAASIYGGAVAGGYLKVRSTKEVQEDCIEAARQIIKKIRKKDEV